MNKYAHKGEVLANALASTAKASVGQFSHARLELASAMQSRVHELYCSREMHNLGPPFMLLASFSNSFISSLLYAVNEKPLKK